MSHGLKCLRLAVGLAWAVPFSGWGGQNDNLSSPAAGTIHRSSEVQAHWEPDALETNRVVLRVTGLAPSFLNGLLQEDPDTSNWQRWLSVYTDMGSVAANMGLPPMGGDYLIRHGTNLVFKPTYPLQPGVSYRAVLRVPLSGQDPDPEKSRILAFAYSASPPSSIASSRVRQIHPSAPLLPENLLKFYIEFTAPMSRGHVYDYIQLLNEQGQEVDLPFLELDEELWNPSMTRLTLFIDPGRIKRGVKPLEDIGPALEEGARYTLAIHRAWRDAQNRPLAEGFRKEFRVGPPDRQSPDPSDWKVRHPAAHSRDALVVHFPEPLDHALAVRMINVVSAVGKPVAGEVELDEQDQRWQFTPAQSWDQGRYQLVVQKIIEDLAGNNIGKPFEVESADPIPKDLASGTVSLDFRVQ